MAKRKRAKLSTPGEHGGLVTLGGSALLALLVVPTRSAAFAAASLYIIAYMARGPVERKVRRFRLRPWDRPAMLAYGLLALLCAAWLMHENPLVAAIVSVTAAAITTIGAIVSRARVHREFVTELFGMGACGGSAGVCLYAGGIRLSESIAAGLAMAGYAAAAVAMVRAEVRKLEPRARVLMSWIGVGLLLLSGTSTLWLERNIIIVFFPRLGHALWRVIFGIDSYPIAVIATRECIELLVSVALASLVLTHTIGPL